MLRNRKSIRLSSHKMAPSEAETTGEQTELDRIDDCRVIAVCSFGTGAAIQGPAQSSAFGGRQLL